MAGLNQMQVHLILHGLLREKLPPDARGRAHLELPEGTTVQAVLDQLGVGPGNLVTVNGEIEPDGQRVLQEGDLLRCFRPAKGG